MDRQPLIGETDLHCRWAEFGANLQVHHLVRLGLRLLECRTIHIVNAAKRCASFPLLNESG